MQLEEHLDGRRKCIVHLLKLLLGVEDAHVCRDGVEATDMNDRDLGLLCLGVVLERHAFKKLWFACNVHIVASFLHTGLHDSFAQEAVWTRWNTESVPFLIRRGDDKERIGEARVG